MDYERIYREFIADRRDIESSLTGYFESHHILPRSLGGGDAADNLIRLTPEDHYFAHLLLAKIHGGKMWAALYAMCHLANKSSGRDLPRLRARLSFGHIRRSLADYYRSINSGPSSPMADKDEYVLLNFYGCRVRGNRFEIEATTGVGRAQISALLLGSKKSAWGWYYPPNNPLGLTKSDRMSIALRCDKKHTLYHDDGRVWTGTVSEFKEMTGKTLYWQHDNHRQIDGWCRSRTDVGMRRQRVASRNRAALAARGCIKGDRNPMFGADRRVDVTVELVHKSGETFSGSLKELADREGLNSNQFGQFKKVLAGKRIVKGFKVMSFHGWSSGAPD